MAFTFVRNMISGMGPVAPPKDNVSFECETESKTVGMACKFDTAGKLVKATEGDLNAAVIALEAGDDGDNIRVAWIMPGNVYKVPLRDADGTVLLEATPDKHANVAVGAQLKITTDGKAADGATAPAAGQPLTVVKMDWDATSDATRAEAMVWVMFAHSVAASPN